MYSIYPTIKMSLLLIMAVSMPLTANARSLNEMFDSMGIYSNTTEPSVLRGQVGNYYNGGSIAARIPNRTLALANITPPALKGGCGGIDLFAGSFSFVSSDQIVALLRNIGSGIVSEAFFLALDTFVPIVSAVIKKVQAMAQWANQQTINSCNIARGVVRSGGMNEMWGETKNQLSSFWDLASGGADDPHDAQQRSTDAGRVTDNNAAALGNPATRDQVAQGNIVWRALWKASFGTSNDTPYKELLMGMVGTVIINGDNVQFREPTDVDFEQLMSGDSADNAMAKVLQCDDASEELRCLSPSVQTVNLGRSFRKITSDRLQSLTDNMRAGIPMSAADVNFIGSASVPVYKVVATAAVMGESNSFMIEYAADILAVDYTYRYFKEALRNVDDAITLRASRASETEAKELQKIRDNADKLMKQMSDARNGLNQKVVASLQAQQKIKEYDRMILLQARQKVVPNIVTKP